MPLFFGGKSEFTPLQIQFDRRLHIGRTAVCIRTNEHRLRRASDLCKAAKHRLHLHSGLQLGKAKSANHRVSGLLHILEAHYIFCLRPQGLRAVCNIRNGRLILGCKSIIRCYIQGVANRICGSIPAALGPFTQEYRLLFILHIVNLNIGGTVRCGAYRQPIAPHKNALQLRIVRHCAYHAIQQFGLSATNFKNIDLISVFHGIAVGISVIQVPVCDLDLCRLFHACFCTMKYGTGLFAAGLAPRCRLQRGRHRIHLIVVCKIHHPLPRKQIAGARSHYRATQEHKAGHSCQHCDPVLLPLGKGNDLWFCTGQNALPQPITAKALRQFRLRAVKFVFDEIEILIFHLNHSFKTNSFSFWINSCAVVAEPSRPSVL